MNAPDPPLHRNPKFLRGAAQAVFALVFVYLVSAMLHNMVVELDKRNLPLGFDFLGQPAGFTISETIIPFDDRSAYGWAFLAGIVNTLQVSGLGIVLATTIGVIVGVGRLSKNFLVRTLATTYVEILRNIPLLVQLIVWYTVVFLNLPPLRRSLSLPGGVQINNRGVYFPWFAANDQTRTWLMVCAVAALTGAVAWWRVERRRRANGAIRTEGRSWAQSWGMAAAWMLGSVAFITAGWALTGQPPFGMDYPVLKGFNFRGGASVSPEFAALLTGLTLYTAAFIAEVVRAGIQAVDKGQGEAAAALGLGRLQSLRHVILPQAMRVIIPPMVNQYLNLTKNSSLAVAIAFPDLVAVGNTIINQSGNAVQMMVLIMGTYLLISLAISWLMNRFNQRFRLAGR